jgi:hypothetical protein
MESEPRLETWPWRNVLYVYKSYITLWHSDLKRFKYPTPPLTDEIKRYMFRYVLLQRQSLASSVDLCEIMF